MYTTINTIDKHQGLTYSTGKYIHFLIIYKYIVMKGVY